MRRVRVTLEGRVTGVGFRYSAYREAMRHPGLHGHVRNLDSRRVECLLQGGDDDVHAMITWLRHGPPNAHVVTCRVQEEPPEAGADSFQILL